MIIRRPVPNVREGRDEYAVITLDIERDCDEDAFDVILIAKDATTIRTYVHMYHASGDTDLQMPFARGNYPRMPAVFLLEAHVCTRCHYLVDTVANKKLYCKFIDDSYITFFTQKALLACCIASSLSIGVYISH